MAKYDGVLDLKCVHPFLQLLGDIFEASDGMGNWGRSKTR
jgi:hypothetical protein